MSIRFNIVRLGHGITNGLAAPTRCPRIQAKSTVWTSASKTLASYRRKHWGDLKRKIQRQLEEPGTKMFPLGLGGDIICYLDDGVYHKTFWNFIEAFGTVSLYQTLRDHRPLPTWKTSYFIKLPENDFTEHSEKLSWTFPLRQLYITELSKADSFNFRNSSSLTNLKVQWTLIKTFR